MAVCVDSMRRCREWIAEDVCVCVIRTWHFPTTPVCILQQSHSMVRVISLSSRGELVHTEPLCVAARRTLPVRIMASASHALSSATHS